MDGVINVYKEKGYTSHDVVAKMRGILRMKKIGHTGTLDPQAEGVLPVCLGRGTKLCDLLTDKTKEYQAVLLLGRETDTQDLTGRILSEQQVERSKRMEQVVTEAVMSFLGSYLQVPPMYSALKVNGKKLYELARAGKEVERQPRPVEILELEIEKLDLPRVTMRVVCSKGTYIRTLCYDIGRKLRCGGCMESLVRTRVDRFDIRESLRLSEIERLRDQGGLERYVWPVDAVFAGLPGLMMRPEGDKLVHNGNPFRPELAEREPEAGGNVRGPEESDGSMCRPEEKTETWENGRQTRKEPEDPCEGDITDVRVYDSKGEFIGIYRYEEEKKRYQPQKIFLGGS